MHMEGNCRSENLLPSADIGCGNELNRSHSYASTLTAENCEDVLHCLADVKPDDSTMWTDEKHSLYLELLEVSFVKQLHQSMGLVVQCSGQNKRGRNISQIFPINVNYATEQYGCRQKINYKKGNPFSSVSADLHNPYKILRDNGSKCLGIDCPSASAYVPELFTTSSAENHAKEGTGQNFVDEDIQNKSNTRSRVKRLKTSLADSPSHGQITPYHQAIDSSTLGGELTHNECVSKTSESSDYPPT